MNQNTLPQPLSAEEQALVAEIRALWKSAVTKTYTVGFTIADTSVDLAAIADMLVYPRRDGIYQVVVEQGGLSILEALEAAGRIKALADNSVLNYSSGMITDVAFFLRSPEVDLSTVPGLRIRLHSGHDNFVCGEVVGDAGVSALKALQEAHLISLPS